MSKTQNIAKTTSDFFCLQFLFLLSNLFISIIKSLKLFSSSKMKLLYAVFQGFYRVFLVKTGRTTIKMYGITIRLFHDWESETKNQNGGLEPGIFSRFYKRINWKTVKISVKLAGNKSNILK